MRSLFGVELPTPVNFLIAFIVVLALIGAVAWLVRRLGASRLEATMRGRQPRVAVIDSAAVDGRRKLVIIRRDNVEHLLLIGGPTDVVVESNIVRAAAATAREPTVARNGGAEPVVRSEPTLWPLPAEPATPPSLPLPVRPERAPRMIAEESHAHIPPEPAPSPAPPTARPARPADTLAGLAAELSRSAAETAPSRPALQEPPITVAAQTPAQPAPNADQTLAEMAQRLEAALRRPLTQKVAAETGAARTANSGDGNSSGRSESKPAAASVKGSNPASKPLPANLEQEMASLLTRSGKT